MKFRALQISMNNQSTTEMSIVYRTLDDLPPGEVLIRVQYSSLNFKDAMSCSGHKGVTRCYPHTPGIDAAGIVEKSADPHFKNGDKVVVTGYDLGMNTAGGFSEYIRVPASWPVHLPQGLSRRRSMMFGTAGFTAALSVFRLREQGIMPPHGRIIVSGASGGVGMMAVALLAHLGYEVTAVSGKESCRPLLLSLGATEVLTREFLSGEQVKVFIPPYYIAGVDTAGGKILGNMLKHISPRGIVTCCGMTSGTELTTSIFPFILRGVHLIGIDSAYTDRALKNTIWSLLADQWRPHSMDYIINACDLEQIPELVPQMLDGQLQGRYLVKIGI